MAHGVGIGDRGGLNRCRLPEAALDGVQRTAVVGSQPDRESLAPVVGHALSPHECMTWYDHVRTGAIATFLEGGDGR